MSDTSDPDRDAVDRFQAGQDAEAAFRSLVERHYRSTLRFFLRRGIAPPLSHDLTQETFLRVYTGLNGFRGGARFDTWLYRIAANTLFKHRRHGAATKRRTEADAVSLTRADDLPDVDPTDSAPSPLEAVLSAESMARLDQAIEALPPRMQACLRLRTEQGLRYRQIGALLGVSAETVKAHLWKARKLLAQALQAADEEDP